MTDDYMREGCSTFAVERHPTYQRELRLGDPYVITARLLSYNSTGIHRFDRMYHAENDFLAATAGSMTLRADLRQRRICIRNPIFSTEPARNA